MKNAGNYVRLGLGVGNAPPWSPRDPKEQGPTPPANRCPTCGNLGLPNGCPKCMRFP